ncbi:hypothetical protein GUJ93_ZPchr0008g11386 [Zizania palustris]|uniref:Uncharacterized protein n=1 Tax=Zizania palustris TaxID=103762 RepID=A0A8J5RF95_ZIZPA|nr:hypothetical protein GUJ93_ZPchr0008g11386 [Zizania palustris]
MHEECLQSNYSSVEKLRNSHVQGNAVSQSRKVSIGIAMLRNDLSVLLFLLYNLLLRLFSLVSDSPLLLVRVCVCVAPGVWAPPVRLPFYPPNPRERNLSIISSYMVSEP